MEEHQKSLANSVRVHPDMADVPRTDLTILRFDKGTRKGEGWRPMPPTIRQDASLKAALKGKKRFQYLLSDELWVMGGFHLERAVLGPQVDRSVDAGASLFVNLPVRLAGDGSRVKESQKKKKKKTNHLGGFWARYTELCIGVLLPVAEEEREFGKKAIVGVAEGV